MNGTEDRSKSEDEIDSIRSAVVIEFYAFPITYPVYSYLFGCDWIPKGLQVGPLTPHLRFALMPDD